MELLFAYIDHYRTFHKQSISFSKKFNVVYDAESNALDITRNDKYFNIYPDNIVGITGVLGKNASGKTSLLNLVGDTVSDRWKNFEMIRQEDENPFIKVDFLKDSKVTTGYRNPVTDYFLVYYYGKDKNDIDLFVLETNSPGTYKQLFTNCSELGDYTDENSRLFYAYNHSWLSCVFYLDANNKPVYESDSDKVSYFHSDFQPLNECFSIVSFHTKYGNNHSYKVDDEDLSCISLRRRHAQVWDRTKYNMISFLIEKSSNLNTDLQVYRESEYTLKLDFLYDNNVEYEKITHCIDYRLLPESTFTLDQKIILEFLRRYVEYIMQTAIYENKEKDKLLVPDISEITYENIVNQYKEQIKLAFSAINSRNMPDLLYSEFEQSLKAFEEFLENATSSNIEYKAILRGMEIIVHPNSEIQNIKTFFERIVDEQYVSQIEDHNSIFNTYGHFVNSEICNLSDGIKDNIMLFSAIHEQIHDILPEKTKYILIFDEIERSMHPEMCRNLLNDLVQLLGHEQYKDKTFQLIFASHSPFIASDISKENAICLKKESIDQSSASFTTVKNMNSSPFGQNIHTILRSQFFLTNTFGAYATEVIHLIINFLKTESRETAVETLNDFYHRSYTADSREPFEFIQSLIDGIGEDIIRIQLQREYKKWLKQHPSV